MVATSYAGIWGGDAAMTGGVAEGGTELVWHGASRPEIAISAPATNNVKPPWFSCLPELRAIKLSSMPFWMDSGARHPGEPEVGQVDAVGVAPGLVQARSLLAVGRQGQGLLLLVSQHHDGQGLSVAALDRLGPVVDGGHCVLVGPDHDVSRVHARGGRGGVRLNAANQQTGTAGHTKEAGELRGHLLEEQAGIGRVHHHGADEAAAAAHGWGGCRRGNGIAAQGAIGLRNLRLRDGEAILQRLAVNLFMGRHLRGYGHQLSVAADDEGDGLARRGIVQHAAKLVLTLDGVAVHLQDDVVLAQTCLAGRSVMVYQNDLAAASLFQLERAELRSEERR